MTEQGELSPLYTITFSCCISYVSLPLPLSNRTLLFGCFFFYTVTGIDKSRVLVKIASTWEGIRACEILQKEGISCNMTLLFCLAQVRDCFQLPFCA